MSKFLEFFSILIGALLQTRPIVTPIVISGIYLGLQLAILNCTTERRFRQVRDETITESDWQDKSLSGQFACGLALVYIANNIGKYDKTYRRLAIIRNTLSGIVGLLYMAACYSMLCEPISRLIHQSIPTINANTYGQVISAIIGFIASIGILPVYFIVDDRIDATKRKIRAQAAD